MVDDHLRSKTDNENNYNTIFVLSQNIEKNNYKSSVIWVLHYPEGVCMLQILLEQG